MWSTDQKQPKLISEDLLHRLEVTSRQVSFYNMKSHTQCFARNKGKPKAELVLVRPWNKVRNTLKKSVHRQHGKPHAVYDLNHAWAHTYFNNGYY